jgi:hypothetical protein
MAAWRGLHYQKCNLYVNKTYMPVGFGWFFCPGGTTEALQPSYLPLQFPVFRHTALAVVSHMSNKWFLLLAGDIAKYFVCAIVRSAEIEP